MELSHKKTIERRDAAQGLHTFTTPGALQSKTEQAARTIETVLNRILQK